MPSLPALNSSGSRDLKRPRPIPKAVKDMIRLMVRGLVDDPNSKPLTFIEAGRIAGLRPDIARRWLDRPNVIASLRVERRVYREALCAANEGALARIRDTSENGMAVIGSVRTLEQMNEEDVARSSRGIPMAPGFLIVITDRHPQQSDPPMVDVTPTPAPVGGTLLRGEC